MIDATADRSALEAYFTPLWTPPAKICAADWIEQNVFLPSDNNAVPGYIVLMKWQRDLVNMVTEDNVRTVVLMCAAQIGKSVMIFGLAGYYIANEPGPMIHVSPDKDASKNYVTEIFDLYVARSPALRKLVGFGAGKRGSGNRQKFKRFPGGSIAFADASRPVSLTARSIKVVLGDELDRWPNYLQREGDPATIVRKRTQVFQDFSKTIFASTPTVAGSSRIEGWHDKGTAHEFWVSCKECGVFQTLRTECVHWPAGKPAEAVYRCEHCHEAWSDNDRAAALDRGEWRAGAEPADDTIISFHASVLLGFNTTHANVARAYEATADDDEERRVFRNLNDGRTFKENENERLDPEYLRSRAITITEPLSPEVLHISAAIDIQSNRSEVLWCATASNNRQAVLDHRVYPGDPSSAEFWDDLSEALGREFALKDGRSLPVAITAIDTGHEIDKVKTFVQKQRAMGRRVLPIKGMGDASTKIPEAKPIIVEGSRLRGHNFSIWLIGNDTVKTLNARRLRMLESGPNELLLPDHLDLDFFQSLCGEELKTVINKAGHASRSWVKKRKVAQGGGNEVWDLLTYVTAVATKIRLPDRPADQTPTPSIRDLAARLNRNLNSGNEHANAS